MAESQALAGHVALVTGSGRNIGRAIALEMAAAGAAVVVNGHRDQAAIDRVAAEIKAAGGRAIACLADVSKRDQVNAMVETAAKAFGKVDISVSCVAARIARPFLELTEAQWHETIETNLSPAFYLAQAVLPHMLAQNWGRIIHISGTANFWATAIYRAHSVAAKSGLHGLAKALAREFSPRGVTVNTVAPGHIDTERDARPAIPGPEREDTSIPVGRLGRPGEIAYACRFLASDEGAYITGQVIHVNGGQHMF